MSTPQDDLQRLYEDASALDGAQPAPRVRTAVLAHAEMLAQGRTAATKDATPATKTAANWPQWKSGLVASVLLVPLLGMLMLHMKESPQWQEQPPTPAPSAMRSEASTAARPTATVPAPAPVSAAPAAPTALAASPAPLVRKDAAVGAAQRKVPVAQTPTAEAAPVARAAEVAATAPSIAPSFAPPFAPPPATPTAKLADAAPAPAAALAPPAKPAGLAAAANVAQRAELGESRAREYAPLTSSLALSPKTASPQTILVARGVPRPDAYLLMAAQKGDMQMLQAQLNAGASLQAQDTQGRTALMWAAIGGHTAVVRYLLELGADRTATDKAGLTALQYAQQFGQAEVIALLD